MEETVKHMEEPDPCKDHTGPCRESAANVIRHKIEAHEFRLAGLKRLLSVVENLKPGDPMDALLWELVMNNRNPFFE